MRTLGLLIFDMDGTLIDSMEHHASAFGKILSEKYGIPANSSRKIYFDSAGLPLDRQFRIVLRYHGIHMKEVGDLAQGFWSHVQAMEAVAFPDVSSSIKELWTAGYQLAVISGCISSIVEAKLDKAGIGGCFTLKLGTDYHKPEMTKGEGLLNLIQKKLSIGPEEFKSNSAIVGDGEHDMRIAKKAGLIAVGRLTNNNHSALLKAGANFLIATLEQLLIRLGKETLYSPVFRLRGQS